MLAYRAEVLQIYINAISFIHTRSKFYVEGCMLLRAGSFLFEVDGEGDVINVDALMRV